MAMANRYLIRIDLIILPNYKETTTSSIELRFDESSRASLIGLPDWSKRSAKLGSTFFEIVSWKK